MKAAQTVRCRCPIYPLVSTKAGLIQFLIFFPLSGCPPAPFSPSWYCRRPSCCRPEGRGTIIQSDNMDDSKLNPSIDRSALKQTSSDDIKDLNIHDHPTSHKRPYQDGSLPSAVPAACRLPPIDAYRATPAPSQLRYSSTSPTARVPLYKSHSLPVLATLKPPHATRSNESERESVYGSPPGTKSSRPIWRGLLDNPGSFGREHESRFGSESRRTSGSMYFESPTNRAYMHPHHNWKWDGHPDSWPVSQRDSQSGTIEEHQAPHQRLPRSFMTRSSSNSMRDRPMTSDNHSPPDQLYTSPSMPELPRLSEETMTRYSRPSLPEHRSWYASSSYSGHRMAPYNRARTSFHPDRRWPSTSDMYDRYGHGGMSNYSPHTRGHYPPQYSSMAGRRTPSPQGMRAYDYPHTSQHRSYANDPTAYRSETESMYYNNAPLKNEGELHDHAGASASSQMSVQGKQSKGKDHANVSSSSEQQKSAQTIPKRGGKLPKHITDMLKSWLLEHADHPYPTEEEKRAFCDYTGLDICQISNWFVNARRRILVPQNSRSTTTSATTTSATE